MGAATDHRTRRAAGCCGPEPAPAVEAPRSRVGRSAALVVTVLAILLMVVL